MASRRRCSRLRPIISVKWHKLTSGTRLFRLHGVHTAGSARFFPFCVYPRPEGSMALPPSFARSDQFSVLGRIPRRELGASDHFATDRWTIATASDVLAIAKQSWYSTVSLWVSTILSCYKEAFLTITLTDLTNFWFGIFCLPLLYNIKSAKITGQTAE